MRIAWRDAEIDGGRDARAALAEGAAEGVAERLKTAGLVVAAQMRGARGRLLQPLARLQRLAARAPKQFLIAPQDIRTADPTIAADLHSGHFAFAGRIVSTRGRSPFTVTPPSIAWTQVLTSFEWLRHLRAADTPTARSDARLLVDDWIRLSRDTSGPAWEPAVVARRLMAWLSQSPVILNEADWGFYRRFMRSVGQQTAFLLQILAGGLEGEDRLAAAIAVAAVGLCADGLPAVERRGTKMLAAELRRQILPDGGHIGRNPRLVCDVLLDLLPLRQAYVGRGVQAPEELLNSIDRMLPMLRLFRHGDGALALFNGMGVTAPDVLATLLAYDDPRAGSTFSAPYTGYERLQAGDAVLIVDVGAPPPPPFSTEAHAGCLAFELSVGTQRVVVNCGAPTPSRTDLRDPARVTSAHSTLAVAKSSSCQFITAPRLRALFGPRVVAGARAVTCERAQDSSGLTLQTSHDGYAAEFGVVHHRRLWLAADGHQVRGEDWLTTAAGKTLQGYPEHALRFHLHPAVRPSMAAGRAGVELQLANGSTWLFEAAGLPMTLEDSIFFAATEGLNRTQQMVVRVAAGPPDGVDWSLTRQP